jgi:hypothetical protein
MDGGFLSSLFMNQNGQNPGSFLNFLRTFQNNQTPVAPQQAQVADATAANSAMKNLIPNWRQQLIQSAFTPQIDSQNNPAPMMNSLPPAAPTFPMRQNMNPLMLAQTQMQGMNMPALNPRRRIPLGYGVI